MSSEKARSNAVNSYNGSTLACWCLAEVFFGILIEVGGSLIEQYQWVIYTYLHHAQRRSETWLQCHFPWLETSHRSSLPNNRVDWIFPPAVQLLLLPTSALLYFKIVRLLVPSRVLDVAVLNAKHNEVVWAATHVLPQQSAGLQKRRLSRHRHVPRPPGLTVASCHSDAHGIRAVPHQFLRPWVIITYHLLIHVCL